MKTPIQRIERSCVKLDKIARTMSDEANSEIRDIVSQVVQAQGAIKSLLQLSRTPRTEMRAKLGLDD